MGKDITVAAAHFVNRNRPDVNKLRHSRRIATRFEKLGANFLAMAKRASIRLWLRAYESMACGAAQEFSFGQ